MNVVGPSRGPLVRVWLVAMGLVGSMGCSDHGGPPRSSEGPKKTAAKADGDAASSADGCDAIDLAPPHTGQGVQIVTEMTLDPGEERQTCKLVMTGEDINYNYGEGLFTPGSHHATVWRTSHSGTIPTTNADMIAQLICVLAGSEGDSFMRFCSFRRKDAIAKRTPSPSHASSRSRRFGSSKRNGRTLRHGRAPRLRTQSLRRSARGA